MEIILSLELPDFLNNRVLLVEPTMDTPAIEPSSADQVHKIFSRWEVKSIRRRTSFEYMRANTADMRFQIHTL